MLKQNFGETNRVLWYFFILANYSPLLAMQHNLNPEITFKQHKSKQFVTKNVC